jgi:hypothetical protein
LPVVTCLIRQKLNVLPVYEFQKLWDDLKAPGPATATHHISIFRPIPPRGYYLLGDYAERTYLPAAQGAALVLAETSNGPRLLNETEDWHALTSSPSPVPLLRPPVGYEPVWSSTTPSRFGSICVWRPLPPEGYAALGHVTTPSPELPPNNIPIRCVSMALLTQCGFAFTPPNGVLWSCGPISLRAPDCSSESAVPSGAFYAVPLQGAATTCSFALL